MRILTVLLFSSIAAIAHADSATAKILVYCPGEGAFNADNVSYKNGALILKNYNSDTGNYEISKKIKDIECTIEVEQNAGL